MFDAIGGEVGEVGSEGVKDSLNSWSMVAWSLSILKARMYLDGYIVRRLQVFRFR